MDLLQTRIITCPWCWQSVEVLVDCSAGDQEYVEAEEHVPELEPVSARVEIHSVCLGEVALAERCRTD